MKKNLLVFCIVIQIAISLITFFSSGIEYKIAEQKHPVIESIHLG